MRDVDVGIATRFAPAMHILIQSFLIVFIKKFRLRQAFYFRIVRVRQRLFGNSFFSTVSGLDLLFAVLDNALKFTFADDRIFRIVFRLHDGLDFLVFFRSEKFIRNLETRPELVTDTGLHRKVTAFRNFHRIFDSARDVPEQFHHFLFRAVIELVRREAFVFKTVQRHLERNATQNFVRGRIFGFDVMDIANGHHFAPVLLREFHVKFVDPLLLRNPVIAN